VNLEGLAVIAVMVVAIALVWRGARRPADIAIGAATGAALGVLGALRLDPRVLGVIAGALAGAIFLALVLVRNPPSAGRRPARARLEGLRAKLYGTVFIFAFAAIATVAFGVGFPGWTWILIGVTLILYGVGFIIWKPPE
jgi:uncharacterized membrane protein YfcA